MPRHSRHSEFPVRVELRLAEQFGQAAGGAAAEKVHLKNPVLCASPASPIEAGHLIAGVNVSRAPTVAQDLDMAANTGCKRYEEQQQKLRAHDRYPTPSNDLAHQTAMAQ
jgi:hypothetical protein